MMRRPQFSLKTLLWLMALVAAFFGGYLAGKNAEQGKWLEYPPYVEQAAPPGGEGGNKSP